MERHAAWRVVAVLGVLISLGAVVRAQTAGEAGKGKEISRQAREDGEGHELITRVYSVRDLISPVPEFGESIPTFDITKRLSNSWDAGALFPGAVPINSDGSRQMRQQLLREVLERSVRSQQPWEMMGGRATLDFSDPLGLMIVTQTEAGHDQVATLVAELRKVMVPLAVDVRVVSLDPALLARCRESGRYVFAGRSEREELEAAVRTEKAHAMLHAMSGQRAWHTPGTQRAYLSDLEPVVPNIIASPAAEPLAEKEEQPTNQGTRTRYTYGSKGPSPYGIDPEISWLIEGLAADVQATVSDGGNEVHLVYRLQYAGKPSFSEQTERAGNFDAIIRERPALPELLLDECNGTTRVPLGAAVLVASGRIDAGNDTQQAFIVTVHRVDGQ